MKKSKIEELKTKKVPESFQKGHVIEQKYIRSITFLCCNSTQ